MPNPIADYLFLAALFVPTAGILVGLIWLLIPRRSSVSRSHPIRAKTH